MMPPAASAPLGEDAFAVRAAGPRARRHLALRPFLDALYSPAPAAGPADATIACRCEEVTAGAVRAAARLGATG